MKAVSCLTKYATISALKSKRASEHDSDKFRDSFKIIKEHVHNPSLNLNKTGLFQK